MRYSLFLILLFFLQLVQAQPVQLSGIINHYAAVTALDSCSGKLSVSDTAGFAPGSAALLIQMQGAAIATPNNAAFGAITAINGAGRYEQVWVDSVSTNAVFIRHRLLNQFDWAGYVQLVSYPTFQQAVVSDTLRAAPWNGATGGILALQVVDSLLLNAPIIADGAGFRGGAAFVAPSNNCTWLLGESDYAYAAGTWRSSYKGEGIAIPAPDKLFGRGPQANGGGGANDHNAGGGGGGNVSVGGRGGDNDEPSTFGCDGYYPGLGGRALPVDSSRLFVGGGGGAGHANNNLSSAGGRGGGIVLLTAGTIGGPKALIIANGLAGSTANGDGGGGGGAGGTIWLKVGQVWGNLSVAANGGAGGNTLNNTQDRCFGPGGGGSGGRILSNWPGIPVPSGGSAGIITGSTNACNNSSNGAEAGKVGVLQLPPDDLPAGNVPNGLPEILAGPEPVSACPGDPVFFLVQTNPGPWQYQWEVNTGADWSPISNGAAYSGAQTPQLYIGAALPPMQGYQFRCSVSKAGCGTVTSAAAPLSVAAPVQAAFHTSVNGNTVLLENQSQGAISYWWDFGDGQTSDLANPSHAFAQADTYIITLFAISPCDTAVASQTLELETLPIAAFTAPDSLIDCESVSVSFQNVSSANATAFEWTFTGGTPPAASGAVPPAVIYLTSGTYPVTLVASNGVGADTVIHTLDIQVLGYPQADFTAAVGNNGAVQFENLSQKADTYTWYFGDSTAPVHTQNVLHQYAQGGTFTVTLVVDNFCGTSVLQKTIEVMVTGTHAASGPAGVVLYPNPVEDWLTIDGSRTNRIPVKIRLFDTTGRILLEQEWGGGQVLKISSAGFAPGVLVLVLQYLDGKTEEFQLVKQ